MAIDTKLYDILGVSPDTNQEEIKKAFKAKAKKYHPDLNKEPDSEKKMQEINEAYSILSDDEKRARYDREGVPKSGPQEPPHDFQVRANFRKVLEQLIANIQDPTYESPMDKWAEHYFNVKTNLSSAMTQCENQLQKYRTLQARLTFTAKTIGEEDIFAQISNGHIASGEAQKAALQKELQMLEDMNELSKEYTYTAEINPNPQQPQMHPGMQGLPSGFRFINMGPRPASNFGGSFGQ